MNDRVIEHKLQTLRHRFGTLDTCKGPRHLIAAAQRLHEWINADPIYSILLKRYKPCADARIKEVEEHVRRHSHNARSQPCSMPGTFDAHVGALLRAFDVLATDMPITLVNQPISGFDCVEHALIVLGYESRYTKTNEEKVDVVRAEIMRLRDVLIEYLSDAFTVFGLLVRYKQRCELFARNRLKETAKTAKKKENAVVPDLHQYLHDQGVDFWVEPASASGEIDVVMSPLVGGRRVLADAKYVDDFKHAKESLVKGFRQVLDYCKDHDEPVGYLIVYLDLDATLELDDERDVFPCVRLGSYTIYYVVVDIFGHNTTASRRPKTSSITIAKKDILADTA